jgi:tRNA threonylcarbamoyladenosine modification (KEOPS) complex  Pcc1 subunit
VGELRGELLIRGADRDLMINSFRALVKEMRFHRGYVEVEDSGDGVIVRIIAKDPTSMRSLMNSVIKSIYLILTVSRIG